MQSYNHLEIEKKWQDEWGKVGAFKAVTGSKKPKKYALSMFPYPSGAGLHVGHPRGYIANDVYARLMRAKGFNVLHPMGFDSFGLPAEQYAIKTGNNPKVFTDELVKQYRKQLDIIGFGYDWERQVATHRPEYYKWTQWIFLKLYNFWYDKKDNKAMPIEELVKILEKEGNEKVDACCDADTKVVTAGEWKGMNEVEKQKLLMKYRLAYEGYSEVNWCPELGTVLANDEIVDGPNGTQLSERGNFPVEKKTLRQWFLRITAYADRLISGLDTIDWPSHIKEIQKNWIGRSEGSEVKFEIRSTSSVIPAEAGELGVGPERKDGGGRAESWSGDFSAEKYSGLQSENANLDPRIREDDNARDGLNIEVFTTRADTLFGVTYVVIAPEHELVQKLLDSVSNKDEVLKYIEEVKNKTAEDRTADNKEKTGVPLNGVTAINPANGDEVPVWIADYVLASYGTGAVMAVPAHDDRDFAFAKKYNLPIKVVVERKFVITEGDAALRAGEEIVKRNAICAVIRNPKTDKFLCISWKNFKMNGLVTGGIEEGEDMIGAAIREIQEETGYKNVKFVKDPNITINTFFYHRVKKTNRWARFHYLSFEIENEERDNVSEEESAVHEVVWKSRNELESYLTVVEGTFISKNLDCNELAYTDYENGILVDSGLFSGIDSEEARKEITKAVGGKFVTKYKMRDAVFARQRYWGEPIPLIHEKDGTITALSPKDLPLELPEVESYAPTGNAESPLSSVPEWIEKGYETNTMPGWAGSSWYFLRYMDPQNDNEFASEESLKYWGQVDMYVGGAEHATGHLLYSRFWNKFLHDLDLVPNEEPFKVLRNQGMILGADHKKMSKRWGNVVNPDDVVALHGADTLRVFEMFIGPFDSQLPWSTDGIIGSRRFVEKVWRLQEKVSDDKNNDRPYENTLHKTIKKVGEDIESFNFNTAISAMMICLNEMEKSEKVYKEDFEKFIQILSPFAPHITEEIWSILGNKSIIQESGWPEFDPKKLVSETIKLMVQVNGKVRGELIVSRDIEEKEAFELAKSSESVAKWLGNGEIIKVIFVPNRLINIVVNITP
jgi:leucyl-tRNA synthetase